MDKKEKLLQTALELFVSHGFNDTPTSRIVKEAGIATGTMFYFFPTKDDLIISLFLKLKRLASESIDLALAEVRSTKEAIKTYYVSSLKWSLLHPNEFSFLAQFSNSPYLKKIRADEMNAQIAPVLQLFNSAVEERLIVDIDVHLLYALISSQVFGVNRYLASNEATEAAQQGIIENTFTMFWTMIERR